jgi:two-component system, LytTR family, sensor kinase
MRARDSRLMVQSRITRPRVIFGIATLLGCFSAFQASQFVRFFSERDTPFWILASLNFGYWYTWALLAPIVLLLASRFPLDRERWMRSLPVHLVAVLALTFVHVVMAESIRYSLALAASEVWMKNMTWWSHVSRTYFISFDWEMMTYWAIIGFWHATAYYRVAQDRALKASRLGTQLAEAQLQALQRQLHPHFLFNTLNAISALMHRDVEAADQMLARLSDLLRIALDMRGAQEVALKDELEFLQKYLEIEQTRFGERLAVRYDIDPATLDAQVPNLILQPLVENSVRHAVAVRIEPGLIAIRARKVGTNLELSVHDNGPGLPKAPGTQPGKGVGLSNTRSRLEHLYGASQVLRLEEPPAGGLIVTVMLPFREEADVAEIVETAENTEAEEFTEDIKGVA